MKRALIQTKSTVQFVENEKPIDIENILTESDTNVENLIGIEQINDDENDKELEDDDRSNLPKKKRKKNSDMWNHFKEVLIEGRRYAQCNYCEKYSF